MAWLSTINPMEKKYKAFFVSLTLAFGIATEEAGAKSRAVSGLPEKTPDPITMTSQESRCIDGKVSKILVDKSDRTLELLDNKGDVLCSYGIALGINPVGDKVKRGDNKTPEGDYTITSHNPKSAFTLSLRISYPNAQDIAEARNLGVSPGGDIYIHGTPTGYSDDWRPVRAKDWTEGCIALKNSDMREVYSAVKDGTPITIRP